MRYWTYAEIRDKVERDLALEQETFITPSEMRGYCNEAIDEAESEIHTLYEDYFLKSASISLVLGQALYDLPTDIYANKIRGVTHTENDFVYNVEKFGEERRKFEDIAYSDTISDEFYYRYILTNESAAAGIKLRLVPAAAKSLLDSLTIWYLRNANRIEADTDVCDIPEFVNFVMQYMKARCYEKEGHPNLAMSLNALEFQRRTMINTLSNMIPDGDTEIEKDMEFYEDTV